MPVELPTVNETSWYTLAEVSALVPGRDAKPINPQTLRTWIREGRLESRKIGGTVYVQGCEIRRVLSGEAR